MGEEPLVVDLPDDGIFEIHEEEIWVDSEEDWDMTFYFDGSRCEKGNRARVIMITPQGVSLPYSFKLEFPCTNNNVEYEALICTLKIAKNMRLKKIKLYGDSLLVVIKSMGPFNVKNQSCKKGGR